jgi:hypothetical protein
MLELPVQRELDYPGLIMERAPGDVQALAAVLEAEHVEAPAHIDRVEALVSLSVAVPLTNSGPIVPGRPEYVYTACYVIEGCIVAVVCPPTCIGPVRPVESVDATDIIVAQGEEDGIEHHRWVYGGVTKAQHMALLVDGDVPPPEITRWWIEPGPVEEGIGPDQFP